MNKEAMNKEAIDSILEKNPKLASARAKLEAMKPGAFCLHRAWGFGRIKDYDIGSGKLLIDFDGGKSAHPMDPAFCVERLELLPDTNILVRQRTDPVAIEELVKKHPADLVVEILTHAPDRTMSAIELENLLNRLLGERFKKWWSGAKKHLAKDPRVATPAKKADPYVLREEPLKPEQEVLEEYYVTKQPKKKILLAEKLYQIANSVEEIEKDLPRIFDDLTLTIREARQLTIADRLHGVWVRNDLARHLHAEVDKLDPTSESIILGCADLSQLAEQLPANFQRRFLDVVTRVYPDSWQEVIINLLRNSQGKFTAECISFLVDKNCAEQVADCFRRWLNEQTLKNSVLLWIIRNRHSRKFAKLVDGMISPRLLAAIFYAIDSEALQNTSNRRITLADALSEDPDLIADLLADANDETARDLAQTLLLNQGFEDLTKKSLIARFIRLFPKIQSLVAGEATSRQAESLFVSQESLENRKREYEKLVQVLIPENKLAIQTARELGDLRENAEYKMARQEQDTLLARKSLLETEMSRARVTNFSETQLEAVGIGSIVELFNRNSNRMHRYALLGAWDSNPEKGVLSYKTPLGQSLLGKKVGDVVRTEIEGTVEEWTLRKIERWVDEKK
jgi:transcription elongation GreA/GreB family factor